ncbi:hypothetical protein [Parabacteroides sp. PF5-6]|uniref:hypothetical protein n=1 Tax=Parabacteroides sp. PF5-6 TaxID=1742403 RepID=UPI002406A879|nr:hypothetical protein [Parabacteroides sp. PF5-6]MDF9831620.1 hypothetical protein [Parabacteroides sp. PF5-6]
MKQKSLFNRVLLPLFFMTICLHLQAQVATESIVVGGMDFNPTASDMSGTGWSWNKTTKTLTLESTYSGGSIEFYLNEEANVKLTYSGNVTINESYKSALQFEGGSLTINGSSGTLTFSNADQNNALYIRVGDLIIESGTVSATGILMGKGNLTVSGDAQLSSIANESAGLNMTNGNITISTSADCTFESTNTMRYSGIRSGNDLTIDLTDMAGILTVSGYYGIEMIAVGKLNITGTMNTTGKLDITGTKSYGIELTGDATIDATGEININTQTTGTVCAIGCNPTNGAKNLSIANATLTIAANEDNTTNGNATNCITTVESGSVAFKGKINNNLIINDGAVSTQTVAGVDANAKDMITNGKIYHIDGTLNGNSAPDKISSEDTFIAALRNTDASDPIILGKSFDLTQDVKMGADHAIYTNGKTLTLTNGGSIDCNGNAITINGGGVISIENTDKDGIYGNGSNGNTTFNHITVNLKNTERGGLNINDDIKIRANAKIILNSATGTNLLSIAKGKKLSLYTDAELTIENFSDTGIHNEGVLSIEGGTLTIKKGNGNNYGIKNNGEAEIAYRGGTLTAENGGAIYLAEGSEVYRMPGKFKDQGIDFTGENDITVGAATAVPTANGLSEGLYVWDDSNEMFIKSGTYEEPVDIISHTLTLTVTDGITCDYATGSHTIAEGDHLFLSFFPETSGMTAEDILFLVDGVETAFNASVDGRGGSYILNPIEKDLDVVIALREYPVTLPEIEGLTITASGKAIYGQPFTFTISSSTLDLSAMKVFVNGEELTANALRAESYTYTIAKVEGPIVITLEGYTTGHASLATGKIRVAMDNGQLTIDNEMANAVDIAIYSVTGQNVVSLRALRGSKTVALSAGVYVVRAGTQTWKVMVND